MVIAIIIISIIILFLLILLFMKLSITILFQHAQDNDECRIIFKTFFGLIRYTILIPLIKVDESSPGIVFLHKEKLNHRSESPAKRKKYDPREIIHSFKETRDFARHVIHLHVIIRKFMARVSVTKLEWSTNIGTGDAAQTGIAVGIGWTLKYGVVALVSKFMKLKTKPLLSITPSFQKAVSETKITCMIHFRIGYAMLAGIRILKYWRGNRLKLKSFVSRQANESY
ncbi:DUF2953 domain-containing protein [Anoxybacillus sp. PDR2]|nr:DUF2953 domain-containing protein [Anoxybacillus rupiensis]OQM45735.1 hypothetical protein B6A27_10305 [Anoxybacillus sp. UARK-01]QHC05879.1 DUF2953 domain-containing protein [Anoxybacillus sp. PDR2]